MVGRHAPESERFHRFVSPEPNTGCWLWMGSYNKGGYGQIMGSHGRPRRAHRVAFECYHGDIPAGLDVRHKCDVRACVNPEHLELGTRLQNMADCRERGRIAAGHKLPHTRLTDAQVEAIRADPRKHAQIAADYGVVSSYVGMLKNNRRRTP